MPQFSLRKRVPVSLQSYTTIKEIYKIFPTKSELNDYTHLLNQAVKMTKILDEDNLMLVLPTLLPDLCNTTPELSYGMNYKDALIEYLNDSTDTTERELIAKEQFFNEVLPEVFKKILGTSNPVLDDIEALQMKNICGVISGMPNLNRLPYKKMSMREIINVSPVPEADRKSVAYLKNQLHRIKTFSKYGSDNGLFNLVNNIPTLRASKGARTDRNSLSVGEIELLLENLTGAYKSYVKVLYLTGMRPSELFKTNVHDGVFDLTESTEKLKTMASYRIIPIHSCITQEDINNLEEFRGITYNTPNRKVQYMMKKLGIEGSTYSLRHSFASHLIEQNADANVVSELMGHSHKTMTLSRYAKGYSLDTLKNTIEKLSV